MTKHHAQLNQVSQGQSTSYPPKDNWNYLPEYDVQFEWGNDYAANLEDYSISTQPQLEEKGAYPETGGAKNEEYDEDYNAVTTQIYCILGRSNSPLSDKIEYFLILDGLLSSSDPVAAYYQIAPRVDSSKLFSVIQESILSQPRGRHHSDLPRLRFAVSHALVHLRY
jgi:hypothetical protein